MALQGSNPFEKKSVDTELLKDDKKDITDNEFVNYFENLEPEGMVNLISMFGGVEGLKFLNDYMPESSITKSIDQLAYNIAITTPKGGMPDAESIKAATSDWQKGIYYSEDIDHTVDNKLTLWMKEGLDPDHYRLTDPLKQFLGIEEEMDLGKVPTLETLKATFPSKSNEELELMLKENWYKSGYAETDTKDPFFFQDMRAFLAKDPSKLASEYLMQTWGHSKLDHLTYGRGTWEEANRSPYWTSPNDTFGEVLTRELDALHKEGVFNISHWSPNEHFTALSTYVKNLAYNPNKNSVDQWNLGNYTEIIRFDKETNKYFYEIVDIYDFGEDYKRDWLRTDAGTKNPLIKTAPKEGYESWMDTTVDVLDAISDPIHIHSSVEIPAEMMDRIKQTAAGKLFDDIYQLEDFEVR
tara:strand:+ start:1994 stop:3226 length:1233 start_codon:yes stop_codon:yes gene_type:complete